MISEAILRIAEHVAKRTRITPTLIRDDLFMCIAKGSEETPVHVAIYEDALISLIDMIVLEGIEMTVALPCAMHKHNFDRIPEDLRPVLNLITPYQVENHWTCATLAKPRNAVATWGIAQGAFVEVMAEGKPVIMRIDKAIGFELATKETQDETGALVRKSTITFLWQAKAARCRKYAKRVGIKQKDMDAVLLYFGCPQNVLDGLDTVKTSGKGATISKEAKQKARFDFLIAALDMDDDDEAEDNA